MYRCPPPSPRLRSRGLLSSLERDNAPPVAFRYDDLDRLTERHIGHEPGVQVRRWEYDGVRESPSKVVYEDGSETRFGYDVEGNLLEATDPLGATVRYHYNVEAEFAGVTNSQGLGRTVLSKLKSSITIIPYPRF
ncbi:RHS repeat domain-containing protein [Pectobacterium sp. S5]